MQDDVFYLVKQKVCCPIGTIFPDYAMEQIISREVCSLVFSLAGCTNFANKKYFEGSFCCLKC